MNCIVKIKKFQLAGGGNALRDPYDHHGRSYIRNRRAQASPVLLRFPM